MTGSWLQACLLVTLLFHSVSGSTYNRRGHLDSSHIRIPQLRTEGGLHLPIYRRETNSVRRRGLAGSIGLGNFQDVTYNVLVTVGGISTPVVLDTGSSDLWVISDACTACSKAVPFYPQATFQSVGLDAKLLYGDSQTGTHAFGLIGRDTVDLAGLTLQNQYFAAINDTNTSVEDTGSAGIFGLGFPVNSVIWTALFVEERKSGIIRREVNDDDFSRLSFPNISDLYNSNLNRLSFPDISKLYGDSKHAARQTSSTFSQAVSQSYARTGPLLGRLVVTNGLTLPQFTVTLQRDTVDIGGNVGTLSIGELPKGVKNESITWAYVRKYPTTQGGLPAPPDSPSEEYPITWEVFLDDVYLDGEKLPRSTLSSSSIALSALVDTGNSLLRGPADVVQAIRTKIGNRFPCSQPHTLAFQIGGKMFPVDPRDFVNQEFVNSVTSCTPNLVATDPPAEGRYQYSWSLGDPFLKSVLASFHYGNLTYPSRDPPRMGFLSTVPADADDKLKAAVQAAAQNGGNFPTLSEQAPTGAPTGAIQTNSDGVPVAKPTTISRPNPASRNSIGELVVFSVSLLVVTMTAFS